MTAIDKLRQKIKYARPTRLSDPYDHFSEEHRKELLATPDNKFSPNEFAHLFGPHLRAGHYEEVMYFLPLAFAYFAYPENEIEPYGMILPLVGYTSHHVENLKTDGLLGMVGDCFQECLQSWTKTFTVTHFASDKRGMSEDRDSVKHLWLLSETLYQMWHYKSFAELATEFVQQLSSTSSDPIKAAWFLAYAADKYVRDAQRPRMFKFKFDPIFSVILDHDRLKNAAELVRGDPALWNASPTYWYDTFDTLGLDDYIYLPES